MWIILKLCDSVSTTQVHSIALLLLVISSVSWHFWIVFDGFIVCQPGAFASNRNSPFSWVAGLGFPCGRLRSEENRSKTSKVIRKSDENSMEQWWKEKKRILQELQCILWNSSTCEQTLWLCFMLFFVACCKAARGLISTRKLCLDCHPSKRFVRFFSCFFIFHRPLKPEESKKRPLGHWFVRALELRRNVSISTSWAVCLQPWRPCSKSCVGFSIMHHGCGPNRHVLWPLKVVSTYVGHWVCYATSMVRWFYCHCSVTGKALRDSFLWKRSPWSPWTVTSCLDRAPQTILPRHRLTDPRNATWIELQAPKLHFLNLSGIEVIRVISQLCVRVQTSDCRQFEMGLQSCIALQVSLQFLCFQWKKHFGLKRPLIHFQPAPDRRQLTFSTRIPPEPFLFHSSAF